MRLTKTKIEEVITSILGEEGLVLTNELAEKENVSEFDLAKKTKKDIKVIRRMLYMLYNYNLVGFNRKKDKIKGWYIYYWTIIPENIRFIYYKKKKERLERLREKLKEEENELFFFCPQGCSRLNFDQATEYDFHCPECGELLQQDESKTRIPYLKKEIALLESDLHKELKLNEEHKRARKTKTDLENKKPKKKNVKVIKPVKNIKIKAKKNIKKKGKR